MDTVILSTVIGEDRKLIIDVPEDMPIGRVKIRLTIVAEAEIEPTSGPLTREEARRRLLIAGLLVTDMGVPPDTVPLTQEQLEELGRLPPGARPSEELIDEDRGLY